MTTIAPTPLYHLSSQSWRYSEDELAQIRKTLNEQAVDRVRKLWEQEQAHRHEEPALLQPNASSSTATTPAPASTPTTPPLPSEIQYLTVEDEQALVTYYLTQVAALCGAFKYPEIVTATAMTYLKRFYLRNTCMDYHPKNIMLTCVFLATKTENCSTSIDQFAARIPNSSPADILALEFLVSQSLHFEYKVHHAHVALNGLLLDMQSCSDGDSDDVDLTSALSAAWPKAQAYCRASRLTSVELVYTPAQIALACFRLADPTLVDRWLESKEHRRKRRTPSGHGSAAGPTGTGPGTAGVDQVAAGQDDLGRDELIGAVLDRVQSVVQDAQKNPIDKARVKEVDLRLRWARNPEKDPNSALFKKRKAAEDALRDEKDRAKAARRPATDDSSVFD
ncbi:hypothetical protein JCM3774_003550 [Rhodotorula dairenensis]